MEELATLEFLVDELLLEPGTPRGQECARQLYVHAHRGEDLGDHVPRLLAGEVSGLTRRYLTWALTSWAYRVDRPDLVRTLLERGPALDVLQLDHRAPVSAAVIGELASYGEGRTGADLSLVLTALHRLSGHGADVASAVPLARSLLGTAPTGRGFKRIDLDAQARALLRAAGVDPASA